MSIFRNDEDSGGVTRIGDGYFRFDQQAVDQELNELLADPYDHFISIEFPVLAAEFKIFGHTFHDDEIRWFEEFDDQGVSLSTLVMMGDRPRPSFIDFGASFEDSGLHCDLNGNFADCIDGFCEGRDAGAEFFRDLRQSFEWFEEPVTAPEPGTASVLGLGFLDLGLMRRKAS